MAAQFDDDCKWPRRLLHVPSMTSYPWAPGDCYGDATKPLYLAITYTWGRWRLLDGEEPAVLALPVKGVPWTIPRVIPERFTAAELEQCLNIILEDVNTREDVLSRAIGDHVGPYQFVWIDIACIDQNPNSPDTAAEIGRQAKIFHGASRVYAWLNTLYYDRLLHLFTRGSDLDDYMARMEDDMAKGIVGLDDVLGIEFIEYITSDPWFTSLWTLQESFLRPDAYIITNDVKRSLWADRQAQMAVKDILLLFHTTWQYINTQLSPTLTDHPNRDDKSLRRARELKKTIEETGLLELADGCPTALLAAAQYRQTGPDNTTDRVYGIMQVFDLRVGKSRPGSDPGHHYSLEELEDELGAALMAQDPVLSQLHTYETPPPLGKGWRITKESRAAAGPSGSFTSLYIELGYNGLTSENNSLKMERMSQLSTIKLGENTWARFTGPTVALDRVYGVLHDLLAADYNGWYSDVLRVAPDNLKEFKGTWEPQKTYINHDMNELRDLVAETPGGIIILLGRNYDCIRGVPLRAFGLVMAPYQLNPTDHPELSVWRRAGLCSWKLDSRIITNNVKPFLMADDAAWICLEGLLG